ncbi:hypothetical protein NDU88_004748 [Pleurodeles waltl]|uniref:Uncharacterized protein n=1 Tax=Pleurodeles waltl TaxID=8319 RepID=A0AAV7MAS7_PLEWA|nr:hypothetical protein NDU88_004748 [Pleurodeles waltl]
MGCEVNALAWHTVALGGRRPRRKAALVNIEPYGSQEPMTMCTGDRGTHRRGEDLHCKCCCDHGLEETMAHATGERAPAFTAQELEKLVDGVLPQYALLYGPPDQQVSTLGPCFVANACVEWGGCQRPPENRYLAYHRQGRPDPGGPPETGHPLPEEMGGHPTLEQEDGGGSAGDGLPTWEGWPSYFDPLMSRILAVAYPDLDGRVRTSQQTQGASSGGGEVASEHEGAASHMAMAGHATESEFTSETEGEGSSTAGTRADVSGDSSSEGISLVVAATSVPPAPTGTAATQRTSTALPAAPQRLPRARSPRKVGISFAPGT